MADDMEERELTKDEAEQLDECGRGMMTDEQRQGLADAWMEFKQLSEEGRPIAVEFIQRFTTVTNEIEQTGLTPNTSTNLRACAELLQKKHALEVRVGATFVKLADAIDEVARQRGH